MSSIPNSYTSNISGLETSIQNNYNSIQNTLSDVQSKNLVLLEKQERQEQQLREIEEKEKLILTRSRMLQITHDRNAYKKKIIYVLIAIILLILILTIVAYVFLQKKAVRNTRNSKI